MTESEWLTSIDLEAMLHFVRHRADDNQLRQFAAACLRLVWDTLDETSRDAVVIGERYANNEISDEELKFARRAFNKQIARRHGLAGRLSQAAEQLLRLRFSPLLVAQRARTGRRQADLIHRQCDALRNAAAVRASV